MLLVRIIENNKIDASLVHIILVQVKVKVVRKGIRIWLEIEKNTT